MKNRQGAGPGPPRSNPRVKSGRRGLVLFDLNDTLITEVGAVITVKPEELREAVQRAGRAGWWVGLCSDSPYQPLLDWGCRHGIHPGAIIAENGMVINGRAGYREFDTAAVEARVRLWAETQGVQVFETRALAREFGGYNPDGPGIAFGAGRVCSVSIFCYDQAGACAQDVTRRLGIALRESYGESVDCDPATGFVSVHAFANFRHMKGVVLQGIGRNLIERGGRRLVMIGNSVSDLIAVPRSGESWMVQNASAEAIALAERKLSQPHTRGVIEALDLLSRPATTD